MASDDTGAAQVIVDAFVVGGRAFSGNPAAVVLVPGAPVAADAELSAGFPDAASCGAVAGEFNLSETAFLVRRADGSFTLRWWTPTTEVDLCGHATVAAAAALAHWRIVAAGATVDFHSRSGVLRATLPPRPAGAAIAVELDFPAERVRACDATEAASIVAALAEVLHVPATPPLSPSTVVFVGRNRFDVLVHVDRDVFDALTPAMAALARVEARGVIVTAAARPSEPYAFVSRFFGPRAGVPEDPVTGSAHCALAPYWLGAAPEAMAARADTAGFVLARQASSRGGDVWARVSGERVLLRGDAAVVQAGTLLRMGR